MTKTTKTPQFLLDLKPNLKYYNDMKQLLDAYKARSTAKRIKDNIRKEQDRLNYQNEYNRILGELSKSNAGPINKNIMNERKEQLKKLGAKSVNN